MVLIDMFAVHIDLEAARMGFSPGLDLDRGMGWAWGAERTESVRAVGQEGRPALAGEPAL